MTAARNVRPGCERTQTDTNASDTDSCRIQSDRRRTSFRDVQRTGPARQPARLAIHAAAPPTAEASHPTPVSRAPTTTATAAANANTSAPA